MITVHSLAFSRAVRVVWLLEELGETYELKTYARTEAYRAPPALKAIHPLGKSPVIEDGGLVLGESAAILRYVDGRYGGHRHSPDPGTDAHAIHDEWLDFVEGSMARSVIAAFWAKKNGGAVEEKMRTEYATIMAYLARTLADRDFLMGGRPMLADIQISYLLAMAEASGVLGDHPAVLAYFKRLEAMAGLRRAVARTGPIMPPL
ncbi:glutathione S-transferase [Fulvimarina sp. 2208YS6-2-32]|uniref:Glutathione S-transferase n=1 Tax=Fulvimarina uroteuthidis TaxID=3098149 RepID=A0ABU5I237_9HYPH|nr:glutathione S-transferase [Fulvimarina sp. 2208YS6-2-32]MDY8109165.1 glutathione S-transferase [Fulvimarina sp. 2208YS6-2-32]